MTDLAGVPQEFKTDTLRRLLLSALGRIITSELWTSDLLDDSRGAGREAGGIRFANQLTPIVGYMSNIEYILYGQ